MKVCRFCNSTQITVEDILVQCSNCCYSWINKISDPFDNDTDNFFGVIDNLLPQKEKKVVKTSRKKKKVVKTPRKEEPKSLRLNTIAPSVVKESDTFFSDNEEAAESIKAQEIENENDKQSEDAEESIKAQEIENENDKEESEDEYVVMNNVNQEDNEYDIDFNELEESEKEDEIPQPTKMKRKSQTETDEKPNKRIRKPTNQFNPYILFNKEMRAKLKLENPELGNIQLSKYIGKQWKALSPTERKAYDELSEKKKKEYKDTPIDLSKTLKPPPNVWIYYSKEEVPKIRAQYPQMSVNDASKVASHNWKGLSEEEKNVYRDIAKKAKDEFEEAQKAQKAQKAQEAQEAQKAQK